MIFQKLKSILASLEHQHALSQVCFLHIILNNCVDTPDITISLNIHIPEHPTPSFQLFHVTPFHTRTYNYLHSPNCHIKIFRLTFNTIKIKSIIVARNFSNFLMQPVDARYNKHEASVYKKSTYPYKKIVNAAHLSLSHCTPLLKKNKSEKCSR